MLGIISSRESIKGSFAKAIYSKAKRLSTGLLNSEDIAERDFMAQQESNITIEWA